MAGKTEDAYQIHSTSNKLVPHTGTILGTTTTNQDNRVLLHIVAYAQRMLVVALPCVYPSSEHTFTWDVCPHQLSITQPHPSNLALTRVGLLGLRNSDLDADALHLRTVLQLGRGELAGRLRLAAATANLVVGGITGGAGAEAACCGGEDRRGRGDARCCNGSGPADGGGCEDGDRPGQLAEVVERHGGRN